MAETILRSGNEAGDFQVRLVIQGDKELARKFDKLEALFGNRRKLRELMREVMNIGINVARGRAPFKTGALKNAIKGRINMKSGSEFIELYISASSAAAIYAAAQELGKPPEVITPRNSNSFLIFRWKGGSTHSRFPSRMSIKQDPAEEWVKLKSVNHPGIPPTGYLKGAGKQMLASLKLRINRELRRFGK